MCYRKRYSPRVWQIPTKNIIYFHVGFTERFSIIIKMVFFCFCFYFLFLFSFFALSACFGGCMGSADAGPGHEWLSVSLPHSSWPSPEDWGYCFGVRLTPIPPSLLSFCFVPTSQTVFENNLWSIFQVRHGTSKKEIWCFHTLIISLVLLLLCTLNEENFTRTIVMYTLRKPFEKCGLFKCYKRLVFFICFYVCFWIDLISQQQM